MPTVPLPDHPNLGHLRNEARDLQRAARAGDHEAVALVRELHPQAGSLDLPALPLSAAQLVVARRYRFPSWPALRRHLDVVAEFTRSPHILAGAGTPATPAEEIVRLGVLTYGNLDAPERRERGAALLAASPSLARTDIWTAAAAGDTDAVAGFLDDDPSLATRMGGPFDWVPLLYCAYSRLGGDGLGVASLLLDAGADPGAGYLWEGGPYLFTALTGAFGGGEGNQPPHPQGLALARLLLERGADANDGQTMYNRGPVFPHEDPSHLELLLEFGLGRGDGGPWHRALGPAHPTPAQLLEDELLWSAQKGWARRVALVLAAGVNVHGLGTNHPVRRGLSAWELAVRNGHEAVLALLADAGAAPAEPDPVLDLLRATAGGDRAAVDDLVAAHPGVVEAALAREPDHLGEMAGRGRVGAVALLADLGWDVDARATCRPHRETPLHQAAYGDHGAVVRELLARGADPTVRDVSFNATPAGWAAHEGHTALADLLAVDDDG